MTPKVYSEYPTAPMLTTFAFVRTDSIPPATFEVSLFIVLIIATAMATIAAVNTTHSTVTAPLSLAKAVRKLQNIYSSNFIL